MYEVLISHLRDCAKLDPYENTFSEAANAIEELEYKYKKALSDLVKRAEPPKEELK